MMKRKILTTVSALFVAAFLQGGTLFAATRVVGPPSCRPGSPHFATIQEAINASYAWDTVLVCPGVYPEQVTISQPMYLKGVSDGNAGAAVIVVPPGGLVDSVTMDVSGNHVAAQVLVQNAVEVIMTGLVIDGTGIACATDFGVDRTAGIALNHVGDTQEWNRAVVQNVVVREQKGGCHLSDGVLAENSWFELSTSTVHDIDGNPVRQIGGKSLISENTIQETTGAAVWLTQADRSTVDWNDINNAPTGINLDNSDYVTVRVNHIGPWASNGVIVGPGSSNNSITSNRLSVAYTGITLSGDAAGNKVIENTIINSELVGIADVSAGGGNRVTDNIIREAPFGIWNTSVADIISSNTFVNVAVLMTANPYM